MMCSLTPLDVLIPKMPFSWFLFFWSLTGWPGNGLTGEPHPGGGGLEKKGSNAPPPPPILEQGDQPRATEISLSCTWM